MSPGLPIRQHFLGACLRVTTLLSLMDILKNTPPNWVGSDPCDDWDGIKCKNSRVTSITLSSTGLAGQLSGDIGSLSKLETLSLNSNSFSGQIPHSIGNISKLYWLDLADNQLQGPIPVSSGNVSGLDKLHHAKQLYVNCLLQKSAYQFFLNLICFIPTKIHQHISIIYSHLGKNNLSGSIPPQLFSWEMSLIHVLLESNQLTEIIPPTLGLVRSLEVVSLDSNSLSGPVPPNINNLTNVQHLYLSNNKLSGSLPNLTGMNVLSYLDLSNNSFKPLDFPVWFSTLKSLTTLKMERTQLRGQVPTSLFSLVSLQTVVLKDNNINGTLDVGSSYSNQLRLVDLETNSIDNFKQKDGVSNVKIILKDNPICQEIGEVGSYCSTSQPDVSYSTPLNNCQPGTCSSEQIPSPNCICAYPYTGTLASRSLSFSDLHNKTYYLMLEECLLQSFKSHFLPVDSVLLSHPTKDSNQYLKLSLQVFPSGQDHFNRTGTFSIGFLLSSQTFQPPKVFGPFYFIADKYGHFGNSEGSTELSKSSNIGIIAGAAVGGSVLLVLLLLAGVYAFRQKKRAEKAIGQNNPFRCWDTAESNSDLPQLKEARMFSFEELKKYTKNFSQVNDIGSGGFGKVYKGTLPNGQLIAIKRAQKESMQGKLEFKAEIELLSRIHHKNLVSLLGFCFEQENKCWFMSMFQMEL